MPNTTNRISIPLYCGNSVFLELANEHLELELHEFCLGKALEVLTDTSVLPKLVSGTVEGRGATSQTIERLKTKRPTIYVGS